MSDDEKRFLEKIDPNYAWRITKELVELGPHKIAGTRLEHKTAEWIREEMERIGLADVAMEPFPVTVRDLSKPGRIVVKEGPTFTAWSMPGSWSTPAEGLTGHLVYVQEGTKDDYAGVIDVKDKLVLYKRRWPDMSGEDGIFRSTPALEALTRGAKATVTFDDVGPGDAARIQILLLGKDRYKIRIPCVVLPGQDAMRLVKTLENGPKEVRLYSPIEDPHPGKSHNVIGYIPGTRYPDELLVLSSHYDTWWHGAADSISGIGAILGIARALLEAGIRPERTIAFVAHGAEEQGGETWFDWLVGSYFNIVRNHSDWVGRVVANLNIDCISFRPEDCTLECSPELLPLVRRAYAKRGEKGVIFDQTSPATVLTYTDAAAYIMQGVPSANIMYWPEEYWRYYHTQYDDIAIVTESSLRYAMELWGTATLLTSNGALLTASVESALESLAASVIQNRCLLAEVGLDTDSTAHAAAHAYAAVADARTLTQLTRHLTKKDGDGEEILRVARRSQLSAIRRLNADLHIIGGSFGFQMFYTPDPYARDAHHIKKAIKVLEKGNVHAACEELERVYAMRAAGRYMSRKAYDIYLHHLWGKAEFWCTRMQKYVDVWDEWFALGNGNKHGLVTALSEKCNEVQKDYDEILAALNETIAEVRKDISVALSLLEGELPKRR